MNLKDIHICRRPLFRATKGQVDALAARLWIGFPPGYREFVTQLGEGTLSGPRSIVRVYPPWRIESDLAEWRRRINRYWFWDKGRRLLPKERALECVRVGNDFGGDELVFHPSRPTDLFVLPRGGERVIHAGHDLLSAVEKMCSARRKRSKPLEFDPFDSRDAEPDQKSIDAQGETIDDILALVIAWAKRHRIRAAAQRSLRKNTPKGAEAELMREGIVCEERELAEPGYHIAWRIVSRKTGRSLGIFRWRTMGDVSEESCYSPKDRE